MANAAPSSIQLKHGPRVFEQRESTCSSRASRSNISSNAVRENSLTQSAPLDAKRQVDVSFSSTMINRHTVESIEAFLNNQGLSVQNRFNSKKNENFCRWTLQFDGDDGK
jgi:hypothetical protein